MALSSSPASDNGRIVQGMYEAFGRGDVPAVVQRLADDVEWIETDSTDVPVHGTFHGPEAVLNGVFAAVPEHFETFELVPIHFVESADEVVVSGRLRARTRSGRDLDAPFVHIFTVVDGKVTRNENHHDTALWREALTG